jgi:hypothetical protein
MTDAEEIGDPQDSQVFKFLVFSDVVGDEVYPVPEV